MAVRIYKRHYLLYLRCSIHCSVYCREDYDLLVLIRRSIRLIRVFPFADLVQCIIHFDYVLLRICSDNHSIVLNLIKNIMVIFVIQAFLRCYYER